MAKVFPAAQLMEESLKVAKALARKAQAALRSIKQVINCGCDADLRTGCALEAEAFAVCFASQDAKEGVAAFLEKRKPDFQGSLTR